MPASISSALASPSCNANIASLIIGHRIRLTTKPALFLTPIGPLALCDLIGLDVELAVMEVLYGSFNDSKYRPAPLLREMVDAGMLGRKAGRGFYRYDQ